MTQNEGGPVVIEESPGQSFPCSFCGLGVWAGLLDGVPCVVHERPECETYTQLGPADFFGACIQRRLGGLLAEGAHIKVRLKALLTNRRT